MKFIKYKKSIVIAPLLLIAFVIALKVNAESIGGDYTIIKPKEAKYALLIRETKHIAIAVKTAQQLKEANPNYKQFEIVLCGKSVMQLINNKEVDDIINKGINLGIKFSVCQLSLDKFEIKSTDLPDGLKVVPNGLIRIFELQDEGYKTIEL